MHDGVELESLGVPTAVVVTEAFRHEATVQRRALGMTDLEPVIITHPLSTLTEDEIDGRAREAAEGARRIWRGEAAG